MLSVIGLTDLIPYLENNNDYFDSVVPIRLLAFSVLSAVSYFGDIALLKGPLVLGYAVLEVGLNGLMMVDF